MGKAVAVVAVVERDGQNVALTGVVLSLCCRHGRFCSTDRRVHVRACVRCLMTVTAPVCGCGRHLVTPTRSSAALRLSPARPACLPSPAWPSTAASASCWRLNVAGAYTVPHSLLVLVLWVLLVLVILVLATWSAGSSHHSSAPWVRSSSRPTPGVRVGVG